MKATPTYHTCAATVRDGTFSRPYRACCKAAKYEYNGKYYCATHHPPRVQQRKAVQEKQHREKVEQTRRFLISKMYFSALYEKAVNVLIAPTSDNLAELKTVVERINKDMETWLT